MKIKKILIGLLASCTLLASVPALANPSVERLAGDNRYATSAAISKKSYPQGADTVVVASGENTIDAVTAGPLAIEEEAPILLVGKNLSNEVKEELDRLKLDKIIVVGGVNSVSEELVKSIGGGNEVIRLAGLDRYETSVKIANYMKEKHDYDNYVLASGLKGMDALISTEFAVQKEAAIILSQTKVLPGVIKDLLKQDKEKDIYVMSSTQDIQTSVVDEIKNNNLAKTVDRYHTGSLTTTATKLAKISHPNSYGAVMVSSDPDKMVDALAAGPYAHIKGSPILLTEGSKLNADTKDYLKKENTSKVVIIGGVNTIGQKIEDELIGKKTAIDQKQPEKPAPETKPDTLVANPNKNIGLYTSPYPGRNIKGNISRTGEKIYHVPGGRYYDETEIVEADGERWFATEAEAQAAGWRKSKR